MIKSAGVGIETPFSSQAGRYEAAGLNLEQLLDEAEKLSLAVLEDRYGHSVWHANFTIKPVVFTVSNPKSELGFSSTMGVIVRATEELASSGMLERSVELSPGVLFDALGQKQHYLFTREEKPRMYCVSDELGTLFADIAISHSLLN